MYILHGTWLAERQAFALWGEDTTKVPLYRKGRRGASIPHPFAMSVEAWLKILDEFTMDVFPDGANQIIWLPGAGKQVQRSLEAGQQSHAEIKGEVSLLAWELDVVLLNITDALDLLLQLPANGGRGFQLGHDLSYWQEVGLLAINCLAEGRYIPSIAKQGRQFIAHWEALPDPTLLQQLAVGMPPLCRAMCADLANLSPPMTLLNAFLSCATDTFIRENYTKQPVKLKDAWLIALTGDDAILYDSTAQNQKRYAAWEQWRAVLGDAHGNFKISLRLNEPQETDGLWRIDYLLQAVNDPSLLVPAENVWSAPLAYLDYLEYRFKHPKEKLLAGLGLASRIFTPIERSLHEAKPTGVFITHEEAYAFLTEALPLLETSGFSILVPNWWGKRARLKARAKISGKTDTAVSFLTRDTLLSYDWQLSLGGAPISQEEFEMLVALKQPLVRYKGEWVTLDAHQVKAALAFFEQSHRREITLAEALQTQAIDAEIDGIALESTEVDGELQAIFDRLYNPQSTPPPPIPQELMATLRPYQQRGFGWLAQMRQMGFGACLADDMGLGKTLQTITLWLHERESDKALAPALLVCPTSVVGNWRHEIRRFAPTLRVLAHQGAERLQDDEFMRAVQSVDVVLTSYAILRRDSALFEQIQWSDMILDEAQNIKNASTKQAQAARKIRADFKLALTGTPVENRLSELWSIFQFIMPGYLGSQQDFKQHFGTPIERYQDTIAAQALKKLTAPFILRRMKTDSTIIQDLPDKFENKVYCTLSTEQVTLYEATVRETLEAIESAEQDIARRGNILRMLTQLKQICNHPAQFLKEGMHSPLNERSGKLDRLLEMIEEVRTQNERLLIFTQYAEMGELLQQYLQQQLVDEVLFLHGGTPAKQRDEMVRRFQSSYGAPVFILSLKAGGTGLTLTAANHVFHFDRWYNPAVENQATDRAYRIGQTKAVQVHKFISLGTLEERIDEMIERKQALADAVVGVGEQWISELSNDELRDLVTLRHEALEG